MGAEQSRSGRRNLRVPVDAEKNLNMVASADYYSDTESLAGSINTAATSVSDRGNVNAASDDDSVDSNGNRSSSQQSDSTSIMSRSTLVVVHNVEEQSRDIKLDPLYQRINEIPMFLPILENLSRRFPWSKPDPRELMGKLDAQSVTRMGLVYNEFVRKHTTMITKNQMRLIKKIKQVDEALNKMLKTFTVRQKRCAYYAKKFEQIPDLSRNLSKCQKTLTEALKTAEFLNDLLPEEDKLDKFIWCEEDGSSCFNLNVKEEKPISVDRWD